jgi:hypothetical protein
LNTLQSNFSIVDAIRKSGRGMNKLAIPEMIEWCHKIGYEVCGSQRSVYRFTADVAHSLQPSTD